MQVAFQHALRLHDHAMAPLQQTTPSREFTVTMLAFTAYNLCRNPTLPRIMVSAAFMAWPRLVTRFCKDRPGLQNMGMQLFNVALIRSNPVGVLAGIAACWMAHQCTRLLPQKLHQSARTAAFLGAMVGGAKLHAQLAASSAT